MQLAELDARTKPKTESKEEEAAARAAMEASAMGFVPQTMQLMNEPAYGAYTTADVYTTGGGMGMPVMPGMGGGFGAVPMPGMQSGYGMPAMPGMYPGQPY